MAERALLAEEETVEPGKECARIEAEVQAEVPPEMAVLAAEQAVAELALLAEEEAVEPGNKNAFEMRQWEKQQRQHV